MIDQITVFLENDKGRLAALCRTLGDAGISMHALTVADTASFGVARIIADTPREAYAVLNEKGFRASLTKVFAVEVSDDAGGLAALLEALDAAGINVEYAYCFASGAGHAVDILRVDAHEEAEAVIIAAGFRVMEPRELYA
ncbi:MAG: amino acid-binding protein [Coriobacteriia bacterium]|nr:amino acid-binding protein [Coriobacteriia bacterium]